MDDTQSRILCLRCGAELAKIGRRELHFGQVLRHDPGRVGKLATDAFVCLKCGHIELMHPRYGAELRTGNSPLSEVQALQNLVDGETE